MSTASGFDWPFITYYYVIFKRIQNNWISFTDGYLFTLYSVQNTAYIVRTLYAVQCTQYNSRRTKHDLMQNTTVHTVQYMAYNVRHTIYPVQCTPYKTRRKYTPYNIYHTMYAVQYTPYNIRRTMYAKHGVSFVSFSFSRIFFPRLHNMAQHCKAALY